MNARNAGLLEQAIADLSFRSEGRRKLASTDAMRRSHVAVMRARRSKVAPAPVPNEPVPPARPSQLKKGRAVAVAEPSPEWKKKAGDDFAQETVGKGYPVPEKRYWVRHPIERYGDKLPIEIELALTKFMAEATHHLRVKVSSWNSIPLGGVPSGPRIGGLGLVPQRIRDQHERHVWVFDRLNEDFQLTALTLILREIARPDGSFFSLEAFGAHLFPGIKCTNTRKGISLGMLRALGCELAKLYQLHRQQTCPTCRTIEHSDGADKSRPYWSRAAIEPAEVK